MLRGHSHFRAKGRRKAIPHLEGRISSGVLQVNRPAGNNLAATALASLDLGR